METIVSNEEFELTQEDCLDYLNRIALMAYSDDVAVRGHRIGQAWYHALGSEDQMKLSGSFYDPFYADDWPAVIRALRFLLEN